MTTAQKELIHQQNSAFKAFTDYLDVELGEVRTEIKSLKENPELSGETKTALERLQNEMAEISKTFNEMRVKANQPGNTDAETPEVKAARLKVERKSAYDKALRKGWGSLNEAERKGVIHDTQANINTEYKALVGADMQSGGFLMVPEYVDDLIKNAVLISNMNELVEVRQTNKPYVMTPRLTQRTTAVRISEQAVRTETQNPKFGMVQTIPYESYAFTLVSRTDLDDIEMDLPGFLNDDFSTQFAKLMGYEIINGLGPASNQCLGFLNEPNIVGSAIQTASSGVLDYRSFVTTKQKLLPPYQPNAIWVMTQETLGETQALTDTMGRPLWAPFGSVIPDTFFGRPYRVMPDMPQMPSQGGSAGAFAIAYGDFRACYQLVIRKQISIQTLMERYADQNAIGYYGYFRFGGTVKLAEAVKLMKIKP